MSKPSKQRPSSDACCYTLDCDNSRLLRPVAAFVYPRRPSRRELLLEQPKRSPLSAFRSPSDPLGAPACKHLHTIFLYAVVTSDGRSPRSVVPRAPERRSPVKLLPKMFSVEKNPSHEPAYVWCAPRAQQDRSLGSRVSGQVEARSEPLGFSESRDALAPIRYADHLSLRLPFAHEYYHRTLVITEI